MAGYPPFLLAAMPAMSLQFTPVESPLSVHGFVCGFCNCSWLRDAVTLDETTAGLKARHASDDNILRPCHSQSRVAAVSRDFCRFLPGSQETQCHECGLLGTLTERCHPASPQVGRPWQLDGFVRFIRSHGAFAPGRNGGDAGQGL